MKNEAFRPITRRQRRMLHSLGVSVPTLCTIKKATKLINRTLITRNLGGRQRNVRYRLGADHAGYVYEKQKIA